MRGIRQISHIVVMVELKHPEVATGHFQVCKHACSHLDILSISRAAEGMSGSNGKLVEQAPVIRVTETESFNKSCSSNFWSIKINISLSVS